MIISSGIAVDRRIAAHNTSWILHFEVPDGNSVITSGQSPDMRFRHTPLPVPADGDYCRGAIVLLAHNAKCITT